METDSLARLTANARNPRKISKKKLAMLKESMAYYGDLSGIIQLANGGDLVGGHQRVEAFRGDPNANVEITQRYEPPLKNGTVAEGYVTAAGSRFAYRVCDWAPDKAQGAMLAANKGAGEWDLPLVADMMGELNEAGFNMDLTLFDENERRSLAGEETAPEAIDGQDDAPAVPHNPRAQVGDRWRLGRHTVVCGDSTEITVVERALGGRKAELVWTDPPYGIDYVGGSKKRVAICNDGSGDLEALLSSIVATGISVCKAGAAWYVAAPPGPSTLAFAAALKGAEIWRQTLVWLKNNSTFGRNDYHYRHETIYYGWVPGGAHHAVADRKQDTVWEFDRPSKSPEHPTMKPVALIEQALVNSSYQDAVILDFFGGSGSTLIACEKTGRNACLVELEPGYVDVIIARWEKMTGQKAVLDNSDKGDDPAAEAVE